MTTYVKEEIEKTVQQMKQKVRSENRGKRIQFAQWVISLPTGANYMALSFYYTVDGQEKFTNCAL